METPTPFILTSGLEVIQSESPEGVLRSYKVSRHRTGLEIHVHETFITISASIEGTDVSAGLCSGPPSQPTSNWRVLPTKSLHCLKVSEGKDNQLPLIVDSLSGKQMASDCCKDLKGCPSLFEGCIRTHRILGFTTKCVVGLNAFSMAMQQCNCKSPFKGSNCNECVGGQNGVDCSLTCDSERSCNGHGKCDKNGLCECFSTFAGDDCSLRVAPKKSEVTCDAKMGFASGCKDCLPGYSMTGGKCLPVCSTTCANNGICVAPDTCSCPLGFGGKHCEFQIKDCECWGSGHCHTFDSKYLMIT